MTKDDIIRMARDAGFLIDGDSWIHAGAVLIDGRKSIDKHLERFANLVAEREREDCAKLAEQTVWAGQEFAKAIRARGNT